MLKISDRDFNVAIIQMLQEAIMNTLAVSVKLKSFSEEIKKNQIEILTLQNIKQWPPPSPVSLNGLSSWMNKTEERVIQ